MLILGIDDAARGPVLGPMILAGVLVDKTQESKLTGNGVKDSKLMLHSTRIKVSKYIKENSLMHHIIKIYPDEIDSSLNGGTNLNTLEAKKMAEIVNTINTGKYQKEKIKVIIDCPSTNIKAWQIKLESFIEHKENLEISCEHKADFNHPSVGAASILAKVMREEEVEKIKEKYKEYGNSGSGYPSDPFTVEFLKKNGAKLRDSGIFRKTWATWKALFPAEEDKKQSSLKDFK